MYVIYICVIFVLVGSNAIDINRDEEPYQMHRHCYTQYLCLVLKLT